MDTATSYLGFRLPHPFMAGASPLGAHLDSIKRLEDAGCAAVVLHSLFEEQITLASEGRIHQKDPLDAQFSYELAGYPGASEYPLSPDRYAEHIRTCAISGRSFCKPTLHVGRPSSAVLRHRLWRNAAGARKVTCPASMRADTRGTWDNAGPTKCRQ